METMLLQIFPVQRNGKWLLQLYLLFTRTIVPIMKVGLLYLREILLLWQALFLQQLPDLMFVRHRLWAEDLLYHPIFRIIPDLIILLLLMESTIPFQIYL